MSFTNSDYLSGTPPETRIVVPCELPTKLQTSLENERTLAIPLQAHNHDHVSTDPTRSSTKNHLDSHRLIRKAHNLQPQNPTPKRTKRQLVLQFHRLGRHQRTHLELEVSDVGILATEIKIKQSASVGEECGIGYI